MADESFETCPTDVIRATPERVWELLTNPACYDWLGVKVIDPPARNLAAAHARARRQGAARDQEPRDRCRIARRHR